MRPKHRNNETGMTLIEVLLALLISALLLSAALRATTLLARSSAMTQNSNDAIEIRESLSRLFEMDVIHAKQYRQTENGFDLISQSGLDENQMTLTHRPVRVSYAVESVGSQRCLLRTQYGENGSILKEIVCCDVLQVSLLNVSDEQWHVIEDSLEIAVEMIDGRSIRYSGILQ